MYYNGLFSWKDLVLSDMKKNMGITMDVKTVNAQVLENIYKQYLSYFKYYGLPEIVSRSGNAVRWSNNTYLFASKISSNLQLSKILVLNYFLSIYDLSKKGLIDLKYFSPVIAQQGIQAKKIFYPSIIPDFTKSVSSILTPIMIITALGVGAYAVYKFKK